MSRKARVALAVIALGTIFAFHRSCFTQDLAVPEVLLRADFEIDDAGWQHQGNAHFGLDGAQHHHGRQSARLTVVNRNQRDVPVVIRIDGSPVTARFRKYVYNPAHPPANPFGDLQEPAGKLEMSQGWLTDTVSAGTLTVYTTAYDDDPPAAVKGLTVTTTEAGKPHLEWQPNSEPDLCYYRIYRSAGPAVPITLANQIASTIATGFIDTQAESSATYTYKVVAVDQSGNAGP